MIAVFLNSLRAGGAERAMVNLAGALAERGRAVSIVLVNGDGPLRELVAPGVEIVDLRAYRAVAALPPLVEWLRARRPQVILSACANSNVVAVASARLAGGGIRTGVGGQTTPSRGGRAPPPIPPPPAPPAARRGAPR